VISHHDLNRSDAAEVEASLQAAASKRAVQQRFRKHYGRWRRGIDYCSGRAPSLPGAAKLPQIPYSRQTWTDGSGGFSFQIELSRRGGADAGKSYSRAAG
jgi:hypothetical protein